jgi:hypothetical protein
MAGLFKNELLLGATKYGLYSYTCIPGLCIADPNLPEMVGIARLGCVLGLSVRPDEERNSARMGTSIGY